LSKKIEPEASFYTASDLRNFFGIGILFGEACLSQAERYRLMNKKISQKALRAIRAQRMCSSFEHDFVLNH
jgi:hypothetical protein